MNILIPLDGSEVAERSLEQPARFARGAHEPMRLDLLHVVPMGPLVANTYHVASDNTLPAAVQAAGKYLKKVAARPTLRGLEVEPHVETSTLPVAKVIIAQANELHADLIVMTSHGRSGIARALLGSVTEEVARTSPVPTMIVHARDEEASSPPNRPYTILVPLDGMLFAERALAPAAMIARSIQGTIVLFQVLPSSSQIPTHDRELIEKAEKYLDQVRAWLVKQGVAVQVSLAQGDPATQIVKRTHRETSPCDLIAIATHARKGMEKFLLGSVTDEVLRQAHCPLLIVHPQDIL